LIKTECAAYFEAMIGGDGRLFGWCVARPPSLTTITILRLTSIIAVIVIVPVGIVPEGYGSAAITPAIAVLDSAARKAVTDATASHGASSAARMAAGRDGVGDDDGTSQCDRNN
jgi:hypothetical protein